MIKILCTALTLITSKTLDRCNADLALYQQSRTEMGDPHLNLQETKFYLPAISRSYGLWSELSHHAFLIVKV